MAFTGIVWELESAVMTRVDSDGFVEAQAAGQGDSPRLDAYETLHPFGFISRPQDPTLDVKGNVLESAAPTMMVGTNSDNEVCLFLGDPRAVRLLPTLRKGSAVQYAHVAHNGELGKLISFDEHSGETGTKTIYVEYFDGDTKKAHRITVGVDADGKPICEFVHGEGLGLVCFENSAMLRNSSGSAFVSVNDDGVILNGNVTISGSLTVKSDVATEGDVTAKSGPTPVKLSTHMHPTAMGPSGAPIPSA